MAGRTKKRCTTAPRLRLGLWRGRGQTTFDDVCLMLELEITLHRHKDFRRRLARHMRAAYRLGYDERRHAARRIAS